MDGGPCRMKDLADKAMRQLGVSPELLDERYDKCFCPKCYTEPANQYYARGPSSVCYMPPVGWYRVGIKLQPDEKEMSGEWLPAYHGTRRRTVPVIVKDRLLKIPDNIQIRILPGHIPGQFFTFCTPSLDYAKAYSEALIVRIDPEAYMVNDSAQQFPTVASRGPVVVTSLQQQERRQSSMGIWTMP
ncbi:unnamed protein product [Vitrella brassicaformis CCMP3155]|uniref:Uncharacterized protein n=1 Tax=Vitrella brassicaformis (strain CCMP3155) TaxID=1169540 RepID=A0A0G4ESV6_VITBC|nr:unnamed protein product [Vitrella brassicaformis CCMP3155]|eukprot:CEM01496.1 unnamed protein product [Vitrella brassicaformis CCMP3155]